METHRVAGSGSCAALVGAAAWASRAGAAEAPSDLASKIAGLPAGGAEEAQKVCAALIRCGPPAIAKLVALVGDEFGDPNGVKPKYALHGVVHVASRPGADADRAVVAETLGRELAEKHSDELKAFVCRQLQLCGRAKEVPALASLLASDRLCEPAAHALAAIGGPEAAAALREALPKAAGKRRMALVNMLGRLGDKTAAAEIRKDVAAADADLKVTAWYALGEIGDAGSIDALLKAAEGAASYEKNQTVDACLRLARRLGEAGNAAEAERICRQVMAARKDPADARHQSAALATLARATGSKAVDDVLAAMGSQDARTRHGAARTAVDLARTIRKEKPRESERLLKKAVASTADRFVKQEAELLLGLYDT
jgi:hypothetical protein